MNGIQQQDLYNNQNTMFSNQFNNQNQSYPPLNYYNNNKLNNYQINQQQNSIIWIANEMAAKQYPIQPGVVVPLFDSETQTIYLKYLDAQGKPCMRILDYVDRNAHTVTEEPITQNYVTQDQLESFSNQVTQQMADLQKKLNDFKSKIGNINSKKEAK